MSVSFSKELDENSVIISVTERFDFSLHQKFRESYSQCVDKNLDYFLDLSNTEYMDSSALGMILLLKDHVDLHGGTLVIRKPSETVNKILQIAQFQRLMTIEH